MVGTFSLLIFYRISELRLFLIYKFYIKFIYSSYLYNVYIPLDNYMIFKMKNLQLPTIGRFLSMIRRINKSVELCILYLYMTV